jgi:hypothetical protein
MEEPFPTVTLSIDPTWEPIGGSILQPDGSVTDFRGYMELAAALQRVREQALTASRAPGARSGSPQGPGVPS